MPLVVELIFSFATIRPVARQSRISLANSLTIAKPLSEIANLANMIGLMIREKSDVPTHFAIGGPLAFRRGLRQHFG